MAALDWSQCDAVESVPGRVSGAWVFKNTRMPVSTVFENLEAGATVEEIMEWFDVSREQINAVLEFAARRSDALDAFFAEANTLTEGLPVKPPISDEALGRENIYRDR